MGWGPVDHTLYAITPRAIPVFLVVTVSVTIGTVCGQVPGTPVGILSVPIVRCRRVALAIMCKYKFCRDFRFKIMSFVLGDSGF